MIQIELAKNSRYTLGEMAQMAIEGGCGWLVVAREAAADSVRDLAADLVPLCREAGTILSVENDAAAAKELEAHGVFITDGADAAALREQLGPEAIIGVRIGAAATAVALEKADIDYMTLPREVDAEHAAGIIADARTGGAKIAFAAERSADDMTDENIAGDLAAGFAGFYVNADIFDCDDPAARIGALRETVENMEV